MHNFAALLCRPSAFLSDKTPEPQARGPIVMGASIWIKAIRGYLHFLCGSWHFSFFFDMRQESRHHPPAPGPIEVQIERWKRSSHAGQRSRQAALPHLVMDGHVFFFFFSEVLQQLTGHDEAGAPVALLLSPGMFQGVSDCPGPGCSTLLVSTAYDIQPPT